MDDQIKHGALIRPRRTPERLVEPPPLDLKPRKGDEDFDAAHETGPTALSSNVAERWRQIQDSVGREAAREFILKTLHEMLLTGIPKEQIAQRFGVHVVTVYRWQSQLREKLAEEARNIDPYPLFGETIAHYRAIKENAWRFAQNPKEKSSDRIRALEVAKTTEDSLHKFLITSGFYEAARLRPVEVADGDQARDANLIVDSLKDLLTGAYTVAMDSDASVMALGEGDDE